MSGSPKIAAETARQKSTSKPLHAPLSFFVAKPISPSFTPQLSVPRSFTAFRVACAEAGEATLAIRPAAATPISALQKFM